MNSKEKRILKEFASEVIGGLINTQKAILRSKRDASSTPNSIIEEFIAINPNSILEKINNRISGTKGSVFKSEPTKEEICNVVAECLDLKEFNDNTDVTIKIKIRPSRNAHAM